MKIFASKLTFSTCPSNQKVLRLMQLSEFGNLLYGMFLYLDVVNRSANSNRSATHSTTTAPLHHYTTTITTTTTSTTVTGSTSPKLMGNSPLAKRATVIVLAGFIPGFMVVFLLCRFVPDLATKVSAKLDG